MVPISAVPILAIWSERKARSSSVSTCPNCSVRRFSRRSFNSPAAFTVKVEIKSWSIPTPRPIISRIRSTMTKVFPDPAEADTRILLPLL